MEDKLVFVTVGTTQFNALIEKVTQKDILNELVKKGYNRLLLQIGQGNFEPKLGVHEGVSVDFYRLKDSLAEDIRNADLVISHGGAGCCLEVLDAKKPLIIVINENLMDNHQTELANALESRGHAISCIPETLLPTLRGMELSRLTPFKKAKPELLVNFLQSLF